ncbi:MAG TPA: 7TM-DISM domain-containing protein, partial [Burkholderiaceae bacterium]|nr:7TM-DISM domain-containing protein [Burkholderiaceae bacterium]
MHNRIAMFCYALGLLIFCVVVASLAQAEFATVSIDPAKDHINLSQFIYRLEDPGGRLTLAEIQSPSIASGFRLGAPNIGFTPSAYWLRVTVENISPNSSIWWLDSGNRTLQEIDLFIPDEKNVYQHQLAGSTYSFASRPLPTPNFVFPVQLPPQQSVDIYLRVRSTGYLGVNTSPQLWRPGAYQARLTSQRSQWMFYLGIATALGIFNFLLYFSIRDINYLLYVLSLLSIVWLICSTDGGFGSAFEYLWPNSPVFEQTAWVASILPCTCFPFLFIGRFIEFRRNMPRLYFFASTFLVITSLFLCVLIVISALQLPVSPRLLESAYIAGGITWLIYLACMLSGIGTLAVSGNRSARFIAIAWPPLILTSIAAVILQILGVTEFPMSLVMWASAFELATMSYALADRFNQEKKAKTQAQVALVEGLQRSERELEGKVAQRTRELQNAQSRTTELLHNILP